MKTRIYATPALEGLILTTVSYTGPTLIQQWVKIIWPNAGLMLVQRRRRWTNIKPGLSQDNVFAGYPFNTRHWTNAGLMLVQRLQRWTNISVWGSCICIVTASGACIANAGLMLVQCRKQWTNNEPALGQRSMLLCSTQQKRDIEPMLVECWPPVYDVVSTLNKHWFNVV